ncbi:hypothetical protein BKA66DRAFT_440892 [Pyrenochaeta sp. MPI-SDFR-AT-0127]|nr:hypothetical protein BKA66DRAFT_440892 [Pyrenochaeta sp. MPI-SDFR-AT-0127]
MTSSYSGNYILKLANAAIDGEAQKETRLQANRLVATGELLTLIRRMKTTSLPALHHRKERLIDDQVLLPLINKNINLVQTSPIVDEIYKSWLQRANEQTVKGPGQDKLEQRAREHINHIKLFNDIWGARAALVLGRFEHGFTTLMRPYN